RQVVLVPALDPVVPGPTAPLPEAVEPELVLDADDVRVRAIDLPGGGSVRKRAALADPPPDLGPVGPHRVPLVDRGDPGAGPRIGLLDRVDQVGRERGDPAPSGRVRGNEGDPHTAPG